MNVIAQMTLNGDINKQKFRHYCLLYGVELPRKITRSLLAVLSCFKTVARAKIVRTRVEI